MHPAQQQQVSAPSPEGSVEGKPDAEQPGTPAAVPSSVTSRAQVPGMCGRRGFGADRCVEAKGHLGACTVDDVGAWDDAKWADVCARLAQALRERAQFRCALENLLEYAASHDLHFEHWSVRQAKRVLGIRRWA